MASIEQLTVDRDTAPAGAWVVGDSVERAASERAARRALRGQIARLERELSGVVASRFPHIPVTPAGPGVQAGARLLSLEELEHQRDRLVQGLQQVRAEAKRRVELELGSQELLERMKLEPGRYKFMRLPLANLGQGQCGAWEVRPRLGLIGMLAGWWELKLSSGCPLARGRAPARP